MTESLEEAPVARRGNRRSTDRWSLVRSLGGSVLLFAIGLLSFTLMLRTSPRVVSLARSALPHGSYFLLAASLGVAVAARLTAPQLRSLLGRMSSSWIAGALLATTAAAVCIAPALVSWLDAGWGYSKIGGVLPWSDASGYHIGGMRLLNDGRLDSFNMRRPLNAGFYAVRMALTGGNFWATVLLQGVIVGLSGYFLARVVSRRLGAAAGLAVSAVLFAFILPSLDITLSESLGIALGCLALAALWEGVVAERSSLFALGMLMLTMALDVRAGAFFVLPLLLLWKLCDSRRDGRRAWRPVGFALTAVVAGLLLNLPMNAVFGTGGGQVQSNFSYILYGIAHGGTGWQSASEAVEGRKFATDEERTSAIYAAAFHEIQTHPTNLVRGIRAGYRSYSGRIYDFAPVWVSRGLTLAMVVGWIGLLMEGRNRRLGTMLLAAWIGILLSVPFIFQDGGQRVMASVVPFLAAPPAAGVAVLAMGGFRRFVERQPSELRSSPRGGGAAPVVSGCTVALILLVAGPPIAVATHAHLPIDAPTCPAGQIPVVLDAGPQMAHITVLASDVAPHGFGDVTEEQFQTGLASYGVEIAPALQSIGRGSVVLASFNLAARGGRNEVALVVAPADALPKTQRLVSLCGRPSPDVFAAAYGLMYTDAMKVMR